ncbi:hypothetical protein PG994_007000 [Apiospora phragmitis]|uniref:F-box domain-containing protein n=1 Tax=Apiospora phragmitis TaxID=2905665 RepID=A0ABR1UZL9_9PEZI
MATTPMVGFLGTTELLEQMFLQSDQQTLLTSIQRVCCRWRDIVRTSPALQIHLFRKPAPAREGFEPVLNPLLVTKFPFFFTRVRQTDGGGGGGNGDGSHSGFDDDDDDHDGDDVFYSQTQFHALPLAAHPEPYMRHNATWRTMHVRQPPLEGLGVALPMVRYSQRHLQDVDMGMLYDYVLRALVSSASSRGRPQNQEAGEQEQEWRMVWGRIDGLDPGLELWGGYYEGIRRQLENVVDAVLILRSRGGVQRGGGGGAAPTVMAAATEEDEEDEEESGHEREDEGSRSLARLVHPDSVKSGPV